MESSKRFVKLLEKLFPCRFKIAKLSRIPIVRWIFNKMIFEKNNLTYLTKDNVVEIQLKKIIKPPDSIVVFSKVVEYFIDKSSYRFIMNFCIAANQCSVKIILLS